MERDSVSGPIDRFRGKHQHRVIRPFGPRVCVIRVDAQLGSFFFFFTLVANVTDFLNLGLSPTLFPIDDEPVSLVLCAVAGSSYYPAKTDHYIHTI